MPKKTGSRLTIDAVAQAAAQSANPALSPARRLDAIAGLAGFVLRLFRFKEQLPDGPGRIRKSSGNYPGRMKRRRPPGRQTRPGAGRNGQKGGLRHG